MIGYEVTAPRNSQTQTLPRPLSVGGRKAAGVPAARSPEELNYLTVEQLAGRFNVSTKTISRWRRLGLAARCFSCDGRSRIGFDHQDVARFIAENPARVRRGAGFSQLTQEEKGRIIQRARELAQAGGRPATVTKTLANETGRSIETIRYTLKNYDRANPQSPVFPYGYGPLGPDVKRRIYRQSCRGESIEALARRFHRPRTVIRRVIQEIRAERIFELPLDFIPNPLFARVRTKSQIAEIVGQPPAPATKAVAPRVPPGLPAYLQSLYEVPLLSREEEAHLFRKMNYLKYRAGKLREELDPARPRVRLMDRIEELYAEVVATKNRIIRANLRLVVSIAKRHVQQAGTLFELISDGNISLIRAVEKFDFSLGNKFSTYASWAIMKNFARSIPNEHVQLDRFRTGCEELFGAAADARPDALEQENAQARHEADIGRILRHLDPRERDIVRRRFGLDRQLEPRTLKQIGKEMGVSKERVRQIEVRALAKLRQAALDENIQLPD
ncbi:MAG: sigma-70 family RNA polymerase sigma factor [Pirellulaceae bacterium]|jgi:RNA polymerase primary sigma factor/RNA polymerase sigma factor|nr:sigma-70 family RNA polymerase sigma factor [Thermoguttaceae bacterium]MDI9445456.1 sigma-70 family RNA polymerase sigma factor [Planctomycetota bacterium]NLZ00928.1 sigma-70 family RNA polymerase sigma factor [Pirellulaceae bacterium]